MEYNELKHTELVNEETEITVFKKSKSTVLNPEKPYESHFTNEFEELSNFSLEQQSEWIDLFTIRLNCVCERNIIETDHPVHNEYSFNVINIYDRSVIIENINNENILADYYLRDGLTRSTNEQILGFIQDIITYI